ncbi:hypothetical protein Ping_0220 [Psychromonas ingrahamii 37]|uniref:Uncharacterized protein n=1 Tax=Psychromonas ingrahamii (strain DSM 17664 / CCUG 51855 / 37) TaxID=357804 RepID=A1SRH2_PSYIN|nr:hypothetical protein Ping_0220 [Psychromonas ingrahamii 37]
MQAFLGNTWHLLTVCLKKNQQCLFSFTNQTTSCFPVSLILWQRYINLGFSAQRAKKRVKTIRLKDKIIIFRQQGKTASDKNP